MHFSPPPNPHKIKAKSKRISSKYTIDAIKMSKQVQLHGAGDVQPKINITRISMWPMLFDDAAHHLSFHDLISRKNTIYCSKISWHDYLTGIHCYKYWHEWLKFIMSYISIYFFFNKNFTIKVRLSVFNNISTHSHTDIVIDINTLTHRHCHRYQHTHTQTLS